MMPLMLGVCRGLGVSRLAIQRTAVSARLASSPSALRCDVRSIHACSAVLSAEDLASLEAQIKEQGNKVREAKNSGADQQALDGEVAALLALKAKLPDGHEMLQGGKKKKKKKASA